MAKDTPVVSGNMPDTFDLTLADLDGAPGVLSTKAAVYDIVTPVVGNAETFIVRTFRQVRPVDGKEEETRATFTVLLQHYGRGRPERLVLPPAVADAILRQREALTTRAVSQRASKLGHAQWQARQAAGLAPAFMSRPPKRRRKPRKK